MITDNTSQSICLKNGRTIGLAEYGDPNGQPIFYFHGFPGSRLEIAYYDEAAETQGVRIIALDRPGMGLSSLDNKRAILSWADDITEVADQLAIDQFSVFGHSGGAPFIMACLQKTPQRIKKNSNCIRYGAVR